jgi:hypothetical protein
MELNILCTDTLILAYNVARGCDSMTAPEDSTLTVSVASHPSIVEPRWPPLAAASAPQF